jgi:hypothetical protein
MHYMLERPMGGWLLLARCDAGQTLIPLGYEAQQNALKAAGISLAGRSTMRGSGAHEELVFE